jgi:muramoyltetrapeptide carboxypeptidase LdcA involved in peptidoglycan recycling
MACSDGRAADDPVVPNVIDRLADWGIRALCGRTLYRQGHTPFSGSPQTRAQQLMAQSPQVNLLKNVEFLAPIPRDPKRTGG